MNKKQYIKALKEIKTIVSDGLAPSVEIILDEVLAWEEPKPAATAPGEYPLPVSMDKLGMDFVLFSDGACRGNPGPGAWGSMAQNVKGEVILEASGVEVPTTNNKMELEGAIQAIEFLLDYMADNNIDAKSSNVLLVSDSKYVVDGITRWVDGWKKRGWKKADKKAPENLEQWQRLDSVTDSFAKLNFEWVKGHAGHPQNERVDQLANMALDEAGL